MDDLLWHLLEETNWKKEESFFEHMNDDKPESNNMTVNVKNYITYFTLLPAILNKQSLSYFLNRADDKHILLTLLMKSNSWNLWNLLPKYITGPQYNLLTFHKFSTLKLFYISYFCKYFWYN